MSNPTLINDRYEIERPVARGGMGEIWFGRDIRLDRDVAVKIVRFRDGIYDEDFVKRFDRESRIMARLAHPGVPAVYDVGIHENGRPYLVMQRIDGISLRDLLAEHGPLSIGWAAGIGAQICAVLSAAHGASLIHRDLKPSNVMLDVDGAVKVLDFGLATGVNMADFSKITSSGAPLGTPDYMAPEQVLGGIATPQTDLYALGCTLHEALSGRPVFTGTTPYSLMNQQVSAQPGPLRGLRPDVPAELERLVLELLEKKPEDRPSSAAVVYERLLPFAVSLGPLAGVLRAGPEPRGSRMYARALSRVLDAVGAPAAPAARTRATSAQTRPSMARDDISRARKEADSLARQSRFAQAASVLAQTQTAAEALGDIDSDVIGLRLQLANVRFDGGDYRAAAPDYRRLAADIAARDGADNELALQCRMKEATCQALAGETALALRQLEALLSDESRVFGVDDDRPIEVRRQIALLQIGSGDRDRATSTLRRLHTDLTRLYGPDHSSVIEIDTLLAQLAKRPAR